MADRLHIMNTRACPFCGSLPGEPCIGARGNARTALHRERSGRDVRAPIKLQLNHTEVAAILAGLDLGSIPEPLHNRLLAFTGSAP